MWLHVSEFPPVQGWPYSGACVRPTLVTRSSVGPLGCFHFLTSVNDAAANVNVNVNVKVSSGSPFSSSSYPEVRLLGHVTTRSSVLQFLRNCHTVFPTAAPFPVPAAGRTGFGSSQADSCKVVSHGGFDLRCLND